MLLKHIALLVALGLRSAQAFTPISAATAWKSLNPGWNLGGRVLD